MSEIEKNVNWSTGYVQVYTGDGKGKTTAAMGLALRAVGAGLQVFFAQFAKGMEYSELKALEQLASHITLRQYGQHCFIIDAPVQEDIELACTGLEEVRQVLQSGEYPLVVLDEANIAVYYKLFSIEELIVAIDARAQGVEVVITGRNAHPDLVDYADLVTEMREIKHYYNQGVQARTGIEK